MQSSAAVSASTLYPPSGRKPRLHISVPNYNPTGASNMTVHRRSLLTWLALTLAWLVRPGYAGSCAAAQLCCQGRDSGCVIQKASPNAIIEGPRDKPCYCDHACVRLGDCCDDFNETCGASDCSVGGWGEWSECDNKCGPGSRTRSRLIERPERNGGKPCPETEQSVSCQSYSSCRRRTRHFQVREMSFSPSRSGEANLDFNFGERASRGYCATFIMLKISRGCRRQLKSIHGGSRVCIWCREEETHRTDRSVASPCRPQPGRSWAASIGKWEMTSSRGSERCHGRWMAGPYASTRSNCSTPICQGRPLLALV